jgi:hypothetical protein
MDYIHAYMKRCHLYEEKSQEQKEEDLLNDYSDNKVRRTKRTTRRGTILFIDMTG